MSAQQILVTCWWFDAMGAWIELRSWVTPVWSLLSAIAYWRVVIIIGLSVRGHDAYAALVVARLIKRNESVMYAQQILVTFYWVDDMGARNELSRLRVNVSLIYAHWYTGAGADNSYERRPTHTLSTAMIDARLTYYRNRCWQSDVAGLVCIIVFIIDSIVGNLLFCVNAYRAVH